MFFRGVLLSGHAHSGNYSIQPIPKPPSDPNLLPVESNVFHILLTSGGTTGGAVGEGKGLTVGAGAG